MIDPPPGWTSSGSLTATQYGGTGFPTAAQSAEIGGGNNFFAGGNTAVATGTQTIDVSGAASEIDAGTVPASLSGFLGGYAGQADTMSVTATYLGGSNNQLGSLQIGPVTTADRGGLTGLLPRSASGAVPAGTRAIQVVMTSTRVEGTSNDGYGDNLAFALSDKRPTATRVTCNRGPDLFSNSVCTAAVADIGLAPPVAPTGSVRFVTPRGSFDFGDTCQLTSSASSPSTASCSVTYVPSEAGSPAGLPIPVAAGYLGDAVHAPSGAATTPAVNVTAGLIPDPPLASECAAAGRSAVARATSRPRGAIAYGALNTFHYPNENSSFGDRASYGAHLCMDSAQGLLGYVVQGIGYALPVAVGIAAAIDPEPTSKTGLYIGTGAVAVPTGYLGVQAGKSVVQNAEQAIQDPPDRNYRRIERPRSHVRLLVRAGHGLSARGARTFAAMFNTELDFSSLSRAFRTTLNRVAGATKARNRTWEGRQARAAIAYAKRLAGLLDRLRSLTRTAAGFARGLPALSRKISVATLRSTQRVLRRSGFPRRVVRLLHTLGFDNADVRTLRTIGLTARLRARTDSLAKYLADRRLADGYLMAAGALRIWTRASEVAGPARLR